jgi:hypothetical protein
LRSPFKGSRRLAGGTRRSWRVFALLIILNLRRHLLDFTRQATRNIPSPDGLGFPIAKTQDHAAL